MNWQFTESNILTELNTGFMICLLRGEWQQAQEIKPFSPDDLSFAQQATLLRKGLAFAEANHFLAPVCEVVDFSEYQYQRAG